MDLIIVGLTLWNVVVVLIAARISLSQMGDMVKMNRSQARYDPEVVNRDGGPIRSIPHLAKEISEGPLSFRRFDSENTSADGA